LIAIAIAIVAVKVVAIAKASPETRRATRGIAVAASLVIVTLCALGGDDTHHNTRQER